MRAEVVLLTRNIKIMGGDHIMQDIHKMVSEEVTVNGQTKIVEKEVLVETRRENTVDWGA